VPWKPTKFAHVVYRTRRFEEMLEWYETVFGAQVQHKNPALAFLTYDEEHHRFAFLNLAVADPDGTPESERRWCVHHGLTASLYYADPDGNQIEFQVDAFADGGCNEFIRGEEMTLNPVGVEFDPDDWLSRLRGGTPESDLRIRKVHEPISPIRGFAGAH